MNTTLHWKRTFGILAVGGALAWAGAASAAFKDQLEGQNAGSTNWSGGPLNGWVELTNVPCRVSLTGGPASNQTTTISFDHLIGGQPAIGNLLSFTPSANCILVSNTPSLPPGASTWSYSLKYHVTNSAPAEIRYFAFLSAGASRNGANMAMSGAGVLQIAKLNSSGATGNPDLGVAKTGPTNANAGQTINYAITYNVAKPGADAVGVALSDALATNLLFVSASGNPLVGGTAVDWVLGNLKAGSQGRFRLRAQISASAIANSILTNTVLINAAQTDTNAANNIARVATRVVVGCIPPTIAGDPLSATNCLGSSAGLDVVANGSGTLHYQWLKNSAPVSGATNDTYTIGSASAGDAGNYSVLVSNACGVVTSAVATITIVAPPACAITGPTNVCRSATGLVYSNTTTAVSPMYNWSVTGDATLAGPATNASVTLHAGPSGAFTVFSTVTDGASGCSASCSLPVGPNAGPSANDDSVSTDEDAPVAGNALANDTDPDGDALTAAVVSGPSNGTLTFNADGSFTYAPATNFNGSDSFTYRVVDGCGQSSTGTVHIAIGALNDPPSVQNQTPNVDEDSPLIVSAPGVLSGASDPDGDPVTAILISGPTHGTLTLNADGSYSYAPDANFNGSDSFTFAATDGTLTSSVATVFITVHAVNDPPTVQNQTPTVDEDTPLNVPSPGVLTGANDVDGDTLTAILVSNAVHGVAVVNPDGSYRYTPNANFNGTDCFTFAATDGVSTSGFATVCVTVNPVNDAPTVQDQTPSVNQGSALDVPAPGVLTGANDVDGDPITAILIAPATNGVAVVNADGSYRYTPNADFNGTDCFTFAATDGVSTSGFATVCVTVVAGNGAPVANNDNFNTDEDTPLSVPAPGVLGNDTDADGDSLSASLVTPTTHGTLTLHADGSFTYSPTNDFNGADSFTYVANDGNTDSAPATVTITVAPVNDPPSVVNQTPTVNEDGSLTGDVLSGASDPDGDALTAILITQAGHGVAVVNADGSYRYTPNADFNGTDCFTFAATDGVSTSGFATVCVTVAAVNDAPVAGNDSYSTPKNTTLVVDAAGVLGNDTDADDDALSAVLVSGVGHGALTFSPDGSFVYTPAGNFVGSDSFSYKATDGALDSGVATVTIEVTGSTNSAPVAVNDTYTVAEDDSLEVAAPGVLGNDTGDGPLSAVLVSGTSHGTLTFHANGSFTYLPEDNFNGTDTFTYRANDGTFDSGVATVTIAVTPVGGAGDIDLYAKTAAFKLNRAAVNRDSFRIKGKINPRGAKLNLAGATMQISVNGTNLFAPVMLDSAGIGSATVGSVKVRAKLKSASGLYSFTLSGSNLRDAIGLPDANGSGQTTLDVTLTIVEADLDITTVRGLLETPYLSAAGKFSKGKFAFKTNRTLSGAFNLTKTTATQLGNGAFKLAAKGVIENEGGSAVTATGPVTVHIGNAVLTVPGPRVKAAMNNLTRSFKFSVANLADTGIPPAGDGAPTAYRLPISFAMPNGDSTNTFETIIELKRPDGAAKKWSR